MEFYNLLEKKQLFIAHFKKQQETFSDYKHYYLYNKY